MKAFIRYIKQDLLNVKKNLIFLIAFAIFYGVEVLFMNQEAFTGYGQYRPLVFLPALIGVAFGAFSGAFVAGFGNLIYDIINKIFIQHKSLHIGHLIGFIGNFVGGYVVGALAVDIDVSKKGLFSKESVYDYLWNTFVSALGLGGVTGFIIGFGSYLAGRVATVGDALIFAGTIAAWNSIFMLLLLIVLPLYGYLEKLTIEKKMRNIQELTRIKVKPIAGKNIAEIVSAEVIEDVPIERDWTLMGLTIRNNIDADMRYKIEIVGPDIIDPSTLYTKIIKPGETDKVTFSIYPLDKGEREIKVRLIPWVRDLNKIKSLLEKEKKSETLLVYKAKPEESEKISSLSSIIGILVIFGLLAKAFFDLIKTSSISVGMSVALSLFVAEVIIILLWYMYKKYSFKL